MADRFLRQAQEPVSHKTGLSGVPLDASFRTKKTPEARVFFCPERLRRPSNPCRRQGGAPSLSATVLNSQGWCLRHPNH